MSSLFAYLRYSAQVEPKQMEEAYHDLRGDSDAPAKRKNLNDLVAAAAAALAAKPAADTTKYDSTGNTSIPEKEEQFTEPASNNNEAARPQFGAHGASSRIQEEPMKEPSDDTDRNSDEEESAVCHGEPRPLPKYFLGRGYGNNTYFARRLWYAMVFIVLLDIIGICFFWFSDDLVDGGLYVGDIGQSLSFRQYSCEDNTDSCDNCSVVVTYAMFVFHMLPFIVIIGLPASGVRLFEPFNRERRQTASGRNKLKRSLYLQLCELACVVVFIGNVLVFCYFVYGIFQGNNFHCSYTRVHMYTLGAAICYLCTFIELTYFARFREHIKMQLGAFKEADQTGDIRARLSRNAGRYSTERTQIVTDIRKRLFKETELNNLHEVESILNYAKTRLGEDFADEIYTNAAIMFGTFGHSKKNPMHMAAYHGNIAAMELLVNAGFKVNSYDKVARVRFSTGDLFLYFARFFVSTPVMSADETAVSIFRTTLVTPLHCAVSTGQINATKWLIDHGADVNLKSKSSYWSERLPPLFVADNPEIVRVLLQAGANYLEVPDPGRMNTVTVLQLAYLRGNIPIVQELEHWGADVALTPLHEAAADNNIEKVKKLLKAGADPNCVGELGYTGLYRRTPLHWGAINGSFAAVEALLTAGGDPNFQDAMGRSPLHWAARLNKPAVVRLLLQRGADPQLRDYDDKTAILCAASSNDVPESLFDCLVEHGGNINDRLHNGDTALHIAVKRERLSTALALLGAGADIMKTNYEGLRPLDCTTSTKLQFEIKRAAGNRDVMISYTHSHSEFARKLRKSLEDANITTWLDLMDPSGIGGGSVWREEIARGITNASMVVCLLTEDYAKSEWCLKELALAKEIGKPILAVSTERVPVTDDLQVYLYTRQMVPFEPAITKVDNSNPRNITYEYNGSIYATQFRLLLDGIRDEIEKQRKVQVALRSRQRRAGNQTKKNMAAFGSSILEWDPASLGSNDFVFLAHGDEHHTFVRRLYERLIDNGIQCFLDGRQSYVDMTERIYASKEAILKCSAFIVIISSKTTNSELVRDQLAFAEDKGRPIFPIMLNEMEIGLDKHYTLSRLDLYHFTQELGFHASFANLLSHVQQHVTPVTNLGASLKGRKATRPSLFSVAKATAFGNRNRNNNSTSSTLSWPLIN